MGYTIYYSAFAMLKSVYVMTHRPVVVYNAAYFFIYWRISVIAWPTYLPETRMELPSEGYAARRMALSIFRFFIH